MLAAKLRTGRGGKDAAAAEAAAVAGLGAVRNEAVGSTVSNAATTSVSCASAAGDEVRGGGSTGCSAGERAGTGGGRSAGVELSWCTVGVTDGGDTACDADAGGNTAPVGSLTPLSFDVEGTSAVASGAATGC